MPYKLCECVKIEASLPVVIKFGTKKCLNYPIKEKYARKFPAFSKVQTLDQPASSTVRATSLFTLPKKQI